METQLSGCVSAQLDSQVLTQTLVVKAFDYSFTVPDFSYFVNGDLKQFTIVGLLQISPLIDPSDSALSSTFVYSTLIVPGGTPLPTNLIQFDATNLRFDVQSSDSSWMPSYDIEISVTSTDAGWLGQTMSTQFTLNIVTAAGLDVVNNEVVNKLIYITNGQRIDFGVDYLAMSPTPSSVEFSYTVNRLIEDSSGAQVADTSTYLQIVQGAQ